MLPRLIHGDAQHVMEKIDPESVDLVITSPPYEQGKEYESNFVTSLRRWISLMTTVCGLVRRSLKPTGSVVLQLGNHVHRGEVMPLDILAYNIMSQFQFKLRNRIIWTFGHGLHATKRFSGRYEVALWFTLSDIYTFNLDSVRVPQLYPQKRHYKGPKKGELSGNPLGKNPGDFWDLEGVWDITNVKHNHPEKTIHPCQFPEELVRRFVLALTNEGDLVLDPFVGSGTTCVVAQRLGRNSIGIDQDKTYLDIAARRIQEAQ